jgi:hypothetical protein
MRKKLLVAVALVAMLALAGCVTMKVSADIKPDGSGTKTMIVAIDDSVIEMSKLGPTPESGQPTIPEDPFKDARAQAAKIPGATVEDYKDTARKRSGVKITTPFKNLDELMALSSTELYKDFDTIKIERSGDTTTMHISLKMQSQKIGSALSGKPVPTAAAEGTPIPIPTLSPEEQMQMEQMLKAMAASFDISYSVTVPGKIVKYEPSTATVEGNTITWTIDLTKPAEAFEFMVQWSAAGGPPPAKPTSPPVIGATPPVSVPSIPAIPQPSGRPTLPCLPQCCAPGLGLIGFAAAAVYLGRRRGMA